MILAIVLSVPMVVGVFDNIFPNPERLRWADISNEERAASAAAKRDGLGSKHENLSERGADFLVTRDVLKRGALTMSPKDLRSAHLFMERQEEGKSLSKVLTSGATMFLFNLMKRQGIESIRQDPLIKDQPAYVDSIEKRVTAYIKDMPPASLTRLVAQVFRDETIRAKADLKGQSRQAQAAQTQPVLERLLGVRKPMNKIIQKLSEMPGMPVKSVAVNFEDGSIAEFSPGSSAGTPQLSVSEAASNPSVAEAHNHFEGMRDSGGYHLR